MQSSQVISSTGRAGFSGHLIYRTSSVKPAAVQTSVAFLLNLLIAEESNGGCGGNPFDD